MTDKIKTDSAKQSSPDNVTIEKTSHPSDLHNQTNLFEKIKSFLGSWQFKVIIGAIAVLSLFWIIFTWQHIIAMQSLKGWANHAQAEAIDCMMQDSNNDKYISCSAKLDNQIVPLECGTSLFNMGCRVNYGSASPSVKKSNNN